MRVAILSDVHGNSLALDAVLADIDAHGPVDAYWFGGDAAALGFDPAGSIQRLDALPHLSAVRGNTDRYVMENADRADRSLEQAMGDPEAVKTAFAFARGFAWTRGAVTAFGYDGWLDALPVEQRFTLPDGTRLLLVHAAPGTDDGAGISPEQSDEEVAALLDGVDADLVIVGHTHVPLDRSVGDVRVWNLGSVSNPKTDDVRAMWTLLETGESGYTLERHYATYDIEAMLQHLESVHHPTRAVIRSFWPNG